MIAFFDPNALIYRIEGAAPFAGLVNAALEEAARAYPDLGAAVSRLSWLECRAVGWVRRGLLRRNPTPPR